jgi:hypothetical protein
MLSIAALSFFLSARESPREIIDRVDRLLRGESSHGLAVMEVVTENWERSLTMEMWSLGTEHSLVRILAPPKEAGTATLKAGDDIWNYLPKVDRTIKIPASMMMGSWMGSHFTNDDLVKDSRLVDDYDIEIVFEGDRDGSSVGAGAPRPGGGGLGPHQYRVREKLMPVWARCYDEDLPARTSRSAISRRWEAGWCRSWICGRRTSQASATVRYQSSSWGSDRRFLLFLQNLKSGSGRRWAVWMTSGGEPGPQQSGRSSPPSGSAQLLCRGVHGGVGRGLQAEMVENGSASCGQIESILEYRPNGASRPASGRRRRGLGPFSLRFLPIRGRGHRSRVYAGSHQLRSSLRRMLLGIDRARAQGEPNPAGLIAGSPESARTSSSSAPDGASSKSSPAVKWWCSRRRRIDGKRPVRRLRNLSQRARTSTLRRFFPRRAPEAGCPRASRAADRHRMQDPCRPRPRLARAALASFGLALEIGLDTSAAGDARLSRATPYWIILVIVFTIALFRVMAMLMATFDAGGNSR